MEARNQLLDMAAQDPRLASIRPNGLDDVPEYRVDVDWEKAGAQGVPIERHPHAPSRPRSAAPTSTTSCKADGSRRSYVQADAPYRMLPEDLEQTLCAQQRRERWCPLPRSPRAAGPTNSPRLERFNGFPSLNIWAEPAPGRSSGEAMQAMEELVAQAARTASATTGPGFPTRSGWRRPRGRCSMLSPSS